MNEQQLNDLMRGARHGVAMPGLPGDFSGQVLERLGPQMWALWTPRILAGLALVVIVVAALTAFWTGNLVEPEPPVLTLYQGGGPSWWE